MEDKELKEIGFSMNEKDEGTIIVEGVVLGKVSKKAKVKYERQFSKVNLHLFDKKYIEHLQKIEVEIVNSQKKPSDVLKNYFSLMLALLMR
jgi:predicted site-specific integrase-resolvase